MANRYAICVFALGFASSLAPAHLHAQGERYEGRRVAAIRYKPAEQPLTRNALDFLMPLKAGQLLRPGGVSAAIQRLYETGRYTDISVSAELAGEEVVLEFETAPAQFVGRVSVTGVPEPPTEGQLANAVNLELGRDFSEEYLVDAMQNLQGLLRSNGLFQAAVTPAAASEPARQQVSLEFSVTSGERARYAEPVIRGAPERTVESLVGTAHWKRWWGLFGYHRVTDNRTQSGLDRIRKSYQEKDHLMAKVQLEDMAYAPALNTASPVVSIDPGPKVAIRSTGAKLRRGKLRQLVPVHQERSVDRDLLVEGRRNIIQYLQSRGYFDAQVNFEAKTISDKEQLVEYAIDRGEKHKLRHVGIEGNKYFDQRTIRERLTVQPATWLRYRSGRFSESMLANNRALIADLYRENGFRDVRITSRVEAGYRGKPNDIAAFIQIEEGPQWFVSSLEVAGVNLRDYETVMGLLQSTAGQPYSDVSVASDRDSILNYYYNNGFPDAAVQATVTPAAEAHRVEIKYTVTEGRRLFVRDVLVGGLGSTDPRLVQDHVRLAPGDPLSLTRMLETQRRLYDLGIFARVDMALQNPEGRERDKYVLYQLEEARRWSLSYGFGAEITRIGGGESVDAPVGDPGLSPRAIASISRLNFLGQGHTLGLRSRVSNIQQRGIVTYLAPQFRGREGLDLTLAALADRSKDVRTFTSRRLEGSVQFGQRLSRATQVQGRYTFRFVDTSNLKISPELIPRFSQPVRLGIVAGTFIQDRRDNPIDSTRGIYNSLDAGVATGPLAAQSDFLRFIFRNSTYHRLTRDLILARTITFGSMHALSSNPDRDVPLPERFYSGGASSHRAFSENQAGPRDLTTGYPVGGKAVLMNGLELRFPLIGDNLKAVLFHDAGNVYSRFKNISWRYNQRDLKDFDYMVHALGLGFRYRTPVGPVRIDVAYGLNSPRFMGFEGTREQLMLGGGTRRELAIRGLQFHFSLGQTF